MVEISKCKEKCFALTDAGCKILTTKCEGREYCKWYKPKGCEDWVRSERGDEVWLIPPEEYFGKPAEEK